MKMFSIDAKDSLNLLASKSKYIRIFVSRIHFEFLNASTDIGSAEVVAVIKED
ncbi:MAG TPA: hypothetical protein PKZ42_06320 [Syntrophales bacterium]|nr:hypothetical protein [Syntrophales bacterium]